jgi:hypothetical protein
MTMRISKLHVVAVLVLGLMLGLAGCSKLPVETVTAMQTALDGAKAAGAETYARDALNQAMETKAQADAEIETQNGKFALMRSYKKATEMLTLATQQFEQANQAAVAGKERARVAANAAVEAATAALAATNEFLAKAPRGKNTKAELEAMQQELVVLQGTLDEAVAGVAAEDYINAKAKADVVTQKAAEIQADIQNAMDKAKR